MVHATLGGTIVGVGNLIEESGSLTMGLPQLKHRGYTLEDWKSWEGRWELINGVAYDMTPAPSLEHQGIVTALSARLFMALEEARKKAGGGECRVFVAPTDVFLGTGIVQPDLLVVCDPAKLSSRGIEGAPDLVVEVLSPNTAGKDVTRKRWAYETAGIPEYLIVDPDERVAVLLRLEAGRYEEAARIEWDAVVQLLAGKLSIVLGS
jgi:Uma2 family endonuclease